jgi:hypothetical protein
MMKLPGSSQTKQRSFGGTLKTHWLNSNTSSLFLPLYGCGHISSKPSPETYSVNKFISGQRGGESAFNVNQVERRSAANIYYSKLLILLETREY